MPAFDDIVTELPPAAGEAAAQGPAAAGGDVLLTLGEVTFGVDAGGYRELRRQAAYGWPAQQRVGRRPSHQATGYGDEELTITGVLMTSFRGGPRTVEDLRAQAARQEPQLLTAGDGVAFGRWVMTGVDETQSRPFADGTPRRVAFGVTLVRYGDDAPSGRATQTEVAAADAGDVASVVDSVMKAVEKGASADAVVEAAEEAAGETLPPKSNVKRVLDAVLAVAAQGGSPKAMLDTALQTASRASGETAVFAQAATPVTVAYRARAGDALDYIAWRQFGDSAAVVSVLDANPELADTDPLLAAGTLVGLPDTPVEAAVRTVVQLWGPVG